VQGFFDFLNSTTNSVIMVGFFVNKKATRRVAFDRFA